MAGSLNKEVQGEIMLIGGNCPESLIDFFQYHRPSLNYKAAHFHFGPQSNESSWQTYLRHKYLTHLPWMKLNLDGLDSPFPLEEIYAEAKALESKAFPHRANPMESRGWKSICLHGLGDSMTESEDQYGYGIDNAPYKWTPASEFCPVTSAYFKNIFPHTSYYRLRFSYLEPGGYISPHEDMINQPPHFTSINISLNQPEHCLFLMGTDHESSPERWGSVPFKKGGDVFWLDQRNYHASINQSKTTRIHITIHFLIDENDERQLTRFKRILPKSIEDSAGFHKQPPSPQLLSSKLKSTPKLALALRDTNNASTPSPVIEHYTDFTRRFLRNMRFRADTLMYESRSVDDILTWACHNTDADYLVIIASSTIIFLKELFWKELLGLVAESGKDTMVWGHIMDFDKERDVGLHEQTIVIDLKKYRKKGSFTFGFPESRTHSRQAWIRSEEFITDNDTSITLRPDSVILESQPKTMGWKLIDDCLRAGFSVSHLPDEVQETKIFGYPENNHPILEQFVGKKLLHGSIPFDQLEQGQGVYLQWLRRQVEEVSNLIWVYNNEVWPKPLTTDSFDNSKIKGLLCPAAGARDLHHYRQFAQDDFSMFIFDISAPALSFHNFLRMNLSKENSFDAVLTQFSLQYPKSNLIETKPYFPSQNYDELVNQPDWQRFSQINRHYIQCDLISEPEKIFSMTSGHGPLVVDISNIFDFLPWLWIYSEVELMKSYVFFLQQLNIHNPGSLIYGKTPSWRHCHFNPLHSELETASSELEETLKDGSRFRKKLSSVGFPDLIEMNEPLL